MTEPTELRSLKRTIPPDLQKEVEEIQTKIPRTTGSPGDLDEEKKRWLIVGICLHSIISPLLRKYVYCIVSSLYRSLVDRNKIDTQRWNRYLWKFPDTNEYYLNYKSINNNYDNCKNDYHMYDYRVMSHVDLSKLFLQPNMTHYSAIDESCDASALLGMITNISLFPPAVQTVAKKIKSEIRNKWAHCDFKDWNAAKYEDSFNSMTQLVKNVGTSSTEEHKILGELNTWATNGQNLLSGLKLGIDIVDEIRQQTYILSEYALTLRTVTDIERNNLQTELNKLKDDLQERMSDVERKTNEHDETLSNLKKEMKKQVEDHIPPHIRAHHDEELREWEQDQTTFLETRATHHILESLPSHNCIVVTGSSGCGKSSNIHHAALHLRDSFGFEIIPVLTGPSDIVNYYNKNKPQVFVVDDICGKETISTQTLQLWRDYLDKMEKIFNDLETDVRGKYDGKVSSPKLLVSCRLHIYKESQFQRIPLLTRNECNLLSPELCLLADERMHMLHMYLPDDIINNIKQVTENVDYFPLLCKLSKGKTSEEVKKLFTAPLDSIKTTITTIIETNKEQFCVLVLCIVFDDGFNTDCLKLELVSEKKKDKLTDIVKEFDIDLSKEMHRNYLKAGFSTLNGTYLKLRGTEYIMIHDKIYKMAAVICGQHLIECFIKHASSLFIQDHFIFQSLLDIHEGDDSIVLSEDQEELYFERLLCDLNKSVITSTFHNFQLSFDTFRDKLISYLRRSDDAKKVLKKLDIQGCPIEHSNVNKRKYWFQTDYYTTPLIESAGMGYFDIVHFLIVNVKCNVNNKDSKDSSSLYKASENGHSAVAKLLLDNNADVSQCNKYKKSALYAACAGGHKDTVELLLQNNADVNQCDEVDISPLHVACGLEHKYIVELLLQNNADVNALNYLQSESPLYYAAEGGYTDIVQLLLQNKANVYQCDETGKSPLHAACRRGHKDTVELLLQNYVDVNQCDNYDISLLHVACEGGHKNTVELLLQKKADVNLCDVDGESPLYVACKGGHKDIVDLLLKNNADVNKCNNNECSPLYVACKGGHTDTAELLLHNNADVFQCASNGDSILHAVCSYQFKPPSLRLDKFSKPIVLEQKRETVKLLLEWNADVRMCNKNGQTPLDIARESKFAEVVNILEENLGIKESSI